MNVIQAPRASTIIYNLLISQEQLGTWLLPANICPIVPITFMKAQVPFEFADISAKTLHMDLDQAEAWVRKGGRGGILYAHTYGDESTPDDFFVLAKSLDPKITVLDDRCLCIPRFDVKSAADIILFSTGYAKIVELEFGGYAYTREDINVEPVSLPFDQRCLLQLEEEYKSAVHGKTKYRYRESDWLVTDADIPVWSEYRLRVESRLESALAHKQRLNAVYGARLPRPMQLSIEYQMWRFNIRVRNKLQILKSIFDAGLFASSHYASMIEVMSDGVAPVANSLADEVINLFNDHHFDEVRAEKVCEIILKNQDGTF